MERVAPPTNINSLHSLRVSNLTYQTRREDLEDDFKKFGEIADVYLPRDKDTRECRGFAFVRFVHKCDADDAMDAMNGVKLDGREISISIPEARRQDPGEGPRGGGGEGQRGGGGGRRSPPPRSWGGDDRRGYDDRRGFDDRRGGFGRDRRSPPRARGRGGSSVCGDTNINSLYSLRIGNLSYQTRREDLEDDFRKFGEIGDIYLPRDHDSGQGKGFAFVRFYDKRDAQDAMDSMNGVRLDGRQITISIPEARRIETYGGGDKRQSRSRSRSPMRPRY